MARADLPTQVYLQTLNIIITANNQVSGLTSSQSQRRQPRQHTQCCPDFVLLRILACNILMKSYGNKASIQLLVDKCVQ